MELNIYYQNTRSILDKTHISTAISASPHTIFAFTETWLRDDIPSSFYFDESFIVERNDRKDSNKSRGGGCLIAYKSHISAIRMYEWENELPFENVWLRIKQRSKRYLFINVCYISPKAQYEHYSKYINQIIEKFCMIEPNSDFILLGDYNLSSIRWSVVGEECIPEHLEGRTATDLINMLNITESRQLNHLRNVNNRTLDLAITNITNAKLFTCTEISNLDNHHPVFELSIPNILPKFLKVKRGPKLNFFKADYPNILRGIDNIDWNEKLSFEDVNDQVKAFYDNIDLIVSSFTPMILPNETEFPKWFSNEVIALIRDKDYFRKKFKKTNNSVFEEIFKNKRRLLKKQLKICEEGYIRNIENTILTNSKAFFSYTKSLQKSNKLPKSMLFNDKCSDSPEVIANMFADHFESVYENKDANVPLCHLGCDCNSHIEISREDIEAAIRSLDANKSNSPDKIPNIFYQKTMDAICKPLEIIFNASLFNRKFPIKWKESFITPIYKNGKKEDIKNYRPVSITCAISKIFEKIMLKKIESLTHGLIANQQHGFAKRKSVLTNLSEYTNFLSNNITNSGQVDAVYTDFAKAFDKVDHIRLVNKLKRYPINNCTLAWILSFIEGRAQSVCINGIKSRTIIPSSSVPQGCILSPALFSLFINDLPSLLKCNNLLFADDLKLFQKIVTLQDCIKLQKDLDTLDQWCVTNGLQLNVGKCTTISFSYRTERRFQLYNYNIRGTPLSKSTTVRDLGVLFDKKLSFSNHIEGMINRANKMLGFVSKSMYRFSSPTTFKLLYGSYVRPILEYASPIWNPYYNTYTESIESVQRKFTRMYCYKFNIPRGTYNTRLKSMNLSSLFNRRLQNDELLLYKILHGSVITNIAQSLNFRIPQRTTRTNATFYLPFVTSNMEYYSLSLRLQRQHNDYFISIDLLNLTIGRVKEKIGKLLPSERWNNPSIYPIQGVRTNR